LIASIQWRDAPMLLAHIGSVRVPQTAGDSPR
jgi:hypothetical protein